MFLVEFDLLGRQNEHTRTGSLRLRSAIRSISESGLQVKVLLLEEAALLHVGRLATVVGAMLRCSRSRKQHFADD